MEALLDPCICEIPRPEKKPLFASVPLPQPTSQIQSECFSHILSLVENTLFTWNNWSVSLPPSLLSVNLEKPYDAPNAGDLFVHQDFNEYQVLAKDERHRSRRLNNQQLAQLRSYGRFNLDSRDFPGYHHSWHISRGFQKGQARILTSLKNDLCKALEFLVIGSKNRFIGDFFSTKVAVFAFADFFLTLLDLLVGLPHVHHDDIDRRLLGERLEFSVGELTVKSANRQALEAFWGFAERISYIPEDTNFGGERPTPTPPYTFITPSKLPIDLRIYDNQMLERSLAVINRLRQEVHDNWFEDFKNSLYISLKRAGKPDDEIKAIICAQSLKEYANRLFDAMRDNEELQAISPTIVEVLIREATFSLAVTESKVDLCDSWVAHKIATEARLKRAHPILWCILRWRKQQMAKVKADFMQEHRFDVHRSVIKKCNELGLHQHAYFVKRDLLFLTERESRIREELIKTSVSPDNRFQYSVPCKLMRHWKVYRQDTIFPHNRERVDSVLLLGRRHNDVTVETAALLGSQCNNNFNKPEYSVTKHREFKSSTRYVFWRWYTFFIVTWVLLLRSSQLLLYTIPFRSPVSFTALFQKEPIQLSADVDQKTGYLYYTNEKQCQTLHSRVSGLWASAHAAVNSSLQPSGLRRVCIFFSAFVVSLFLILLMPPICLLFSTLSVVLALTVLPILPILSLIFHIFCVILYDFFKPDAHPNCLFPIFEVFIWHLAIRCVLQFIAALFCGLVIYPIIALTISVFGLLRWCLESLWDAIIFYLCLKPCLRIPASDNCILKRRAGPGLSPRHFYKARLADICTVLESQLETIEVDEWRAQMEEIAREPIRAYNSLAESLAWLSLSPVEAGILSQLRGQTKTWLEEIFLKAKQRKEALHPRFPRCQATRLKLSANELQKFISIGASQTQRFYEARILPRLQLLNKNPEDWWSRRGLRTDDFSGLCMRLMKTILGEQFLTSLKETDAVFPLHVRQKAIVSRFAQVLPPTPFNSRRFPATTETSASKVFNDIKPERHQLIRRSTNRSSLPTAFEQKLDSEDAGKSSKYYSYPLSKDHSGYQNRACDLIEQPSIDVDLDNSELDSSSGSWKRQTVILANTKRDAGDGDNLAITEEARAAAEAAVENSISTESLVFIHIELPLFPLSAFVPKALQEAAAAKHNKKAARFSSYISHTKPADASTNRCKKAEKVPQNIIPSSAEARQHIEGLATLLKEERAPILGTLPITATPPVLEIRKPPFSKRCEEAFRKCVNRTLTRKWKIQKFPRTQRELSISSVIENIGWLMHPVEVALTMHSRILEERKINRDHPILAKCIAELTDFPPQCPSPPLKSGRSPLHPIQQQIQTLEFVTAQSTPNPRHYPVCNDSIQCSHSLEMPLERPVESPRDNARDWDNFNLASWWDVESRKGRDYLETTRGSGADFYTAVTDTTTSVYEETEDLEDDDTDPDAEVIDIDPLLEMPEMIIENGEGRFFGRAQGPECFKMVNVDSREVKDKMLGSVNEVQTLQSKPPTVVVTSTSSSAGWPMQRLHSSSSLGAASSAAASSRAIPGNSGRAGDSSLGLNRNHHNGSLRSVGQSIASQSTVRLVSAGKSASQNIESN